MSCKDKIEVYAPSFTKSEKVIAQYLLDNTEHALKLSIHEIAQEISTSASSITRFCHKLGYDNFKAMRFDLAPAADELAVDDFRRVMGWFTNTEDLVKNYLMGMNDVCRQALQLNNMKSIQQLAQLIYDADTIYLFGIGASSIIAHNLEEKLVKLRKRCNFHQDSDFGVQVANSATSRDLAIAISYSGLTEDVLRAARNVRKNGCPVVAMVRQGNSPLRKMADYVISVPNVEQVTRITSLFPRYAQLFLIDILFLNIAQIMGIDPSDILKEYRSIMRPPDDERPFHR